MKTKQAVSHVLKHEKLSKYALAKRLGAQPPSVDQWLNRTRMSKAYSSKFYSEFKIVITDAV